ncbi:MAG: bifunctional oligoribonuclease/PAP phosphatase NrnA [Opitutaceae bacterium]|nr:bifunctional oligoribonuclease/PAP phosphatase NrnA [Opitutaceae bacterium]
MKQHYPQFRTGFHALLAALPGQRVSVVGHQRPDGDCIGSQVALCRLLKAHGIDAVGVTSDPVPRRLRFLLADTPFVRRDNLGDEERVAIFVDCADHGRGGTKLRKRYPEPLAVLDHHISNDGFARFNFIDAGSAATAEILTGMLLDAGEPIDAVTAQALYVGIMTDTGQFRFPSTSTRVFHFAAELLSRGAQPSVAGNELYERESYAKMQLLQRYLASLKLECGGRVCIGLLPHGVFEATGALIEDTEGLVDYARAIDGVEIGVLIEERGSGIKASLRAKHAAYRMDLAAAQFGGGGHASAAGLNCHDTLASFYPKLLAVLERQIQVVDSQSPS